MLTWIISTAQPARPKVIHHKRTGARPVEQILGRGDEEAFFVELRAQALELGPVGVAADQPGDRASSSSVGIRSWRGSRVTPIRARPSSMHRRGLGRARRGRSSSRSSHQAGPRKAHRPREQERGLEVEDDEQDRDQIERTSNCTRLSSKAGKPHSYSLSFSGLGRWAPVRRQTSIGSTTTPPTSQSDAEEQRDGR